MIAADLSQVRQIRAPWRKYQIIKRQCFHEPWGQMSRVPRIISYKNQPFYPELPDLFDGPIRNRTDSGCDHPGRLEPPASFDNFLAESIQMRRAMSAKLPVDFSQRP